MMASSKKLVLTNDSKRNEVLLKDRVKEVGKLRVSHSHLIL